MNYAWEAVLQAEKEKRERDRLRFTQADVPSPYIEVSVTDLNIQCPEEDVIEVNPLYRFAHVFGKIFDKRNGTDKSFILRRLYALHRSVGFEGGHI